MEPIEIVKTQSGIKEFNPVQKAALEKGLLEKKNLVVSSPTASGKTIIAELAVIDNWTKKKGKAIYIVPLRALAQEKYEDFKEKYSGLGLKVGVSTGDLDSASEYLAGKDIVILTSEKLDSLIRHKASWLADISLIVADETHLLTDPSRGPTLEIVLTLLKEGLKPHILALSATISNSNELADWLDANLVVSDYRPVELKKGIFLRNKFVFENETKQIECEDLVALVKKVVGMNKQVLVFLSTRRNTESLAERLSAEFPFVEDGVSEKVLKTFEVPTKQCKKLAACLKHSIAFHHAGLVNKQRGVIEKAFRENKIKVICATTTLAAGLNLPAFMVIIRDLKRFSGNFSQYIPNIEIQQMLGRAGRPKYDKQGIGVMLAKDDNEALELVNRYLLGEIEPIISKLSLEPVLRMQVLSLIATDHVHSEDKLLEFFEKTFFGHTFGTSIELRYKIEDVLKELQEFGFLDLTNFRATRIGKRVAELYLDPLSAYKILESLEKASVATGELFFLQMISSCSEIYPLIRPKGEDFSELEDFIAKNEERFLRGVPDSWDYEYPLFVQSIQTAKLLDDWISERTEEELLEKYGITPGEVYTKKTNAEWLLYAAEEFSRLRGDRKVAKELRKIQIRVKNGVKEELLDLIKVKGIGRVRARRLHNFGVKKITDIEKFDRVSVERLIGRGTLEKILKE